MANRVKPGDPVQIPARVWNGLLQMLGQQDLFAGGGLGFGQKGIKIRNDSGEARGRLDILELSNPLLHPSNDLAEFLREPVFSGIKPAHSHSMFAVLTGPLEPGAIGHGIVLGITPARIHTRDRTHAWAIVTTDSAEHVVSSPTGRARILWKENETGDGYCLLGLGIHGQNIVRFQLTSRLEVNSAATAAILTNGDAVVEIYVADGIGVFSGDSGSRGYAAWMEDSNRYEIIQLEC